MKAESCLPAVVVGLIAIALGLAGCSKESDAPVKIGTRQGSPIRSEVPRIAPNSDSNAAPPKAASNSTASSSEFAPITFDQLAGYTFEVSDDILSPSPDKLKEASAKTAEQIPANVRALSDKKVGIKGFMLPLKVEGGAVTELLIMRDQSMCCFGTVPKINEWVSVKMSGKGVRPVMDQAVTLVGTLKVGEMRENGYLVGIYEMAGDRLVEDAP